MKGEPALTAEEWDGLNFDARLSAGGAGLSMDRTELLVDDGRYRDAERHALAALALYGQSFGFSREMVAALRGVLQDWRMHDDNGFVYEEQARLAETAIDNIESLLPPESAEKEGT